MKNQLLSLYKERQDDFIRVVSQFPDADMAGPFLISPNGKYSSQKNPLLIIGQETNGWGYEINDLEKQMAHYENFNVGIDYYSSPFWNITRKVERALGNDEYTCAWTNISKFDLDQGRPYGEYAQSISKLDEILISEIEILSPKVCLFFTGPSFDYRLSAIFPDIEFIEIEGWTMRQLCQLRHPKLPDNTFRSHHPKSLRMRCMEDDFINHIAGITE